MATSIFDRQLAVADAMRKMDYAPGAIQMGSRSWWMIHGEPRISTSEHPCIAATPVADNATAWWPRACR